MGEWLKIFIIWLAINVNGEKQSEQGINWHPIHIIDNQIAAKIPSQPLQKPNQNIVNELQELLCECYRVSLIEVILNTNLLNNDTICYKYSVILTNNDYQICHNSVSDIILGICHNDINQFTFQSLANSIIDTEYSFALNSDQTNNISNLLFGIKINHFILDSSDKYKNFTLCMQNINKHGITSDVIEYSINNQLVRCAGNDGLPCKPSKTEKQNNPLEDMNTNEIVRHLNRGISARGRQYIQYVFIGIMIVICLNGVCCTLLALRQSGALDKYLDSDRDSDDFDISFDEFSDDDDADNESEDSNDDRPEPMDFNQLIDNKLKKVVKLQKVNQTNQRLNLLNHLIISDDAETPVTPITPLTPLYIE